MEKMTLEEAREYFMRMSVLLGETMYCTEAYTNEAIAAIDRAIEIEKRLRDDKLFAKIVKTWDEIQGVDVCGVLQHFRSSVLGEEE